MDTDPIVAFNDTYTLYPGAQITGPIEIPAGIRVVVAETPDKDDIDESIVSRG